MQSLRLVFLFVVLGTVLVSASPFNAVAKDDSDSSGGSSDNGGGSNSGSNDNSNGNSDSNYGNDDNSNNGNDKSSEDKTNEPQQPINDPLHPGKDDTKDISDIPEENCKDGKCTTPISGGDKAGACVVGIVSPCNGPEFSGPQSVGHPPIPCKGDYPCPHPPSPKPPIIKIIEIIKVIHKGSSSNHHSSSNGMSQLCYSIMRMVWDSHMQKGQNAEIDNYVNNCLITTTK